MRTPHFASFIAAVWAALLAPAWASAASARLAAAREAHEAGEDSRSGVLLQEALAYRRNARVRRETTRELIGILSLGAPANGVMETFMTLPARQRQDAFLDLAAAAHDGGQWELASRAARSAVDVAPNSVLAPVGLDLLRMVYETQGRWDLAFVVLKERMERYSPGSSWARQGAANAEAARQDRVEVEAALRRMALSLHKEAKRHAQRAASRRWMEAPANSGSRTFHGCFITDMNPIDAIIKANARAFHSCIQRQRLRWPELEGEVTLIFNVWPDGTIKGVNVSSDTLDNIEATECIVATMSGLNFGPISPSLLVVRYPLRFPK